MKKDPKDERMIQSIQRGAGILELFIDEGNSLGISDFSRRLSLPKTTVQGIVNTLTRLRYLERDDSTSKYRLGPKLFQLGLTYASSMDILSTARVWMERLCFQFRESVNVGMLVGHRVTVILRVEPENRFLAFPQIGVVIPTHTTAIGKTLMAYLQEGYRDDILKGYLFTSLTKNSITGRDSFIHHLEDVRSSGVAFDNEENFIGMAGIGGPIFNHKGQVLAAFAVTGDAGRIYSHRDEIIASVRYTSSEVSSLMGHRTKIF